MKLAPLETILLSLESGTRPKGGVSADSGEIPSLGGEHVNSDGGFDFRSIKRIPRSFFATMRGGRIAQSDILIVKDGATTGKTSLVREDFPFGEAAVNEHVFCVRIDQAKASPGYVYHFLRSARGQKAILLDFRGATVGGISREFATKTRLPLPPLAAQRRIADVLDRAETLRAKRRATLAELDTLTQSIFLDLFGDLATNPKGWPDTQLGELCEKVIDCPHSTPVYATGRTKYPCVRSSDIQNGNLTFSDTKYVNNSEYEKRVARGKPQVGDVIYCREGARFGNAARIINEMTLCLGQRMVLFRPHPNLAANEYLWAFLSSPAAYQQATSLAGGSASPHVNIRDIVAFRLPHPPITLQREFARRLTFVEKLKTAHRASLAELDVLFASLQYRAFRGEL